MNKVEIILKDKNDFVSRYNNNRISRDLYKYIKDEIKLLDVTKKINIEIKPLFKMSDDEKELLAINIKKTCKEEIEDIKYLHQKVILKEILFLIIGIIITFICFTIKNSPVISEIFLIIGWLFVWESVRNIVFTKVENKIKIKRLKQIIKSDIDYID